MKKHLVQLVLFTLFTTVAYSQSKWELVESLPFTSMTDLVVKNDTLYTASGNIVYVSYDGGTSWAWTGAVAPNVTEIFTLHADGNTVYAGTLGQGVFVSKNDGFHWQPMQEGLTNNALRILDMVQKGDTLLVGTDGAGVYYYLTNGTQWQPYNDGLGDRIAYTAHALLTTQDKVYLGAGVHGYLYHRRSGEAAWTGVPIANPFIGDLTVQSFVEVNGNILAATALGIYRSTNKGQTWQRFGVGFNPVEFGAAEYRLSKTGQEIFLSINVPYYGMHFFRSINGGEDWYHVESFIGGYAYAAGRAGKHIYIATEFGMLRAEYDILSDDDEVKVPGFASPIAVDAVFPNPFSEQLNIGLTLEKNTFVKASLLDQLGREVAVLHTDQMLAGQHTLQWNNVTLPAGLYQLILHSPEGITAKQLIKK